MEETKTSSELHDLCNYLFSNICIKHIFFIFILYIIISSNVFEYNCMNIKIDNFNNNTTRQLLYKSFIFILFYIIIDIFISLNIL